MIRIVPASPAHIRRVANRMRAIDVVECRAHGRGPVDALRYSLRSSSEAWTAMVDGTPEAMFGVAPTSLLGRAGSPWFLGTDAVRSQARAMLVIGRRVLDHWRSDFSALENEVAASNDLAIRLLERWGAEFGEEVVRSGAPFRRFKLNGPPPSQ